MKNPMFQNNMAATMVSTESYNDVDTTIDGSISASQGELLSDILGFKTLILRS